MILRRFFGLAMIPFSLPPGGVICFKNLRGPLASGWFRLDGNAKLIIARNENQNAYLEMLHPEGTFLLTSKNFGGPHALLTGDGSDQNLALAGSVMLRYAQKPLPPACEIQSECGSETKTFAVSAPAEEEQINLLRIV